MKKELQKILLTVFVLTFALFFMMPGSLSYFDKNTNTTAETVFIGEWIDNNQVVTPELIEEIIAASDTIVYVENQAENIDIAFYIEQLIYTSDGMSVYPTFENYTAGEMFDLIESIKEFSAKFLTFNGTTVTMPPVGTVDFVDLGFSETLLPGESVNLRNVLNLADLATAGGNSGPVVITISIETPVGVDASDFAVELFIDSTPFAASRPFGYSWVYSDETTSRSTGTQNANAVTLTTLISSTIYNTRTLIASQNTTYRHQYDVTQETGQWARFPVGPNVFVSDATVLLDNPQTRTGFVVMGQTSGGVSTIKINITSRSYVDPNGLQIVPLLLNISRGLAVNSTGDVLGNQRTTEVIPTIRFKVERAK